MSLPNKAVTYLCVAWSCLYNNQLAQQTRSVSKWSHYPTCKSHSQQLQNTNNQKIRALPEGFLADNRSQEVCRVIFSRSSKKTPDNDVVFPYKSALIRHSWWFIICSSSHGNTVKESVLRWFPHVHTFKGCSLSNCLKPKCTISGLMHLKTSRF